MVNKFWSLIVSVWLWLSDARNPDSDICFLCQQPVDPADSTVTQTVFRQADGGQYTLSFCDECRRAAGIDVD